MLTRFEEGSLELVETNPDTSTSWATVKTRQGHQGTVQSLAFTKETTSGQTVFATCGRDQHLKLWELNEEEISLVQTVSSPSKIRGSHNQRVWMACCFLFGHTNQLVLSRPNGCFLKKKQKKNIFLCFFWEFMMSVLVFLL